MQSHSPTTLPGSLIVASRESTSTNLDHAAREDEQSRMSLAHAYGVIPPP